MLKLLIGAIILCAVHFFADGQSLYEPRNLVAAGKKGTRSSDGLPGRNYWQNHARYNISVSLSPPVRQVNCFETIEYYNNSPDTIRNLTIKLFMNIHKPGAPRATGAVEDYLTAGIKVDSFSINGNTRKWQEIPYLFTWQPVVLPTPLNPHDSVELFFRWNYSVAQQFGREGVIDSTSFFLSYFYPRVAVYDDYNRWDQMEFTDAQEFYSDFNDYSVSVNVPKNFIVWGTGHLQNPESVLQSAFADRYLKSATSDDVIPIVSAKDIASERVTVQNPMNSWNFSSTGIPDVAFGVSDHFLWNGTSVVIDSSILRRVAVQTICDSSSRDFPDLVAYARHIVDRFSNDWPAIPYPYEKLILFQSYLGMEYPMMAGCPSFPDPTMSKSIAAHEISHAYLPFYTGINETRYGFLDEGWATMNEYFANTELMGQVRAADFFKQFRVSSWSHGVSPLKDIPIITPGDAQNGSSLFENEYTKATLGFLALKDLLGDQLFKRCLKEFASRWQGRHPSPWDFFYTFNDVAGNLNWFWNSWYFSNGFIDYSLAGVKSKSLNYDIDIINLGGLAAPLDLQITYADGTKETRHQTPGLWKSDMKDTIVHLSSKKEIISIVIDTGVFMDANEKNNAWRR
ncbi:MAG TPA: M1 family metallopeptidase [Puia sp.]|nr:M1 family metallopeptidase [Puia sp.]